MHNPGRLGEKGCCFEFQVILINESRLKSFR